MILAWVLEGINQFLVEGLPLQNWNFLETSEFQPFRAKAPAQLVAMSCRLISELNS